MLDPWLICIVYRLEIPKLLFGHPSDDLINEVGWNSFFCDEPKSIFDFYFELFKFKLNRLTFQIEDSSLYQLRYQDRFVDLFIIGCH